MKNQLVSFVAWMNTNPQHVRFVSLSLAASLTLLALVFPEAAALAGWAPGGSD
jgi:hypothetical protein